MTIKGEAIPSAPPLSERGGDEEDIPIPLAHATFDAPPNSHHVAASAVPAVQPENPEGSSVSCPPGMVAKSVTTTYPDGRAVTVTEFVPIDQVPAGQAVTHAPVATSMARPGEGANAAPAANQSTHHPPRRDLGTRPASVTCPYCQHTGKTRINHNCGDCAWIAVILLLLFCWPLFWLPLVCQNCQDVEHSCSNCGKLVGKSNAECCNNN
mmetsp:Transcript_38370/g.91868  ORF Transcript_38370/g.91868 Transcript_38370/m.91868 type:complete len:210 (+) Transcript_38370:184-813(+)